MCSLHRVCTYAKYRQMCSICIGVGYADDWDMRMPDLCRCQTYGYATPIQSSYFLRWDPKKGSSGSSSAPPARSGHRIPYLVVIVPFHARWYPIYCVTSCSGHTAAAHRKTPLCLFRVHDSLPESCKYAENRIIWKPLFGNLIEWLYAWLLFQYVKFIFVKVTFSTEWHSSGDDWGVVKLHG